MQHKKKAYTTTIMAFLALAIILAVIPMASAAGTITLTPTAQAPGATVAVNGTGFGATKSVGIGFGAEVAVTGEVTPTPTGSGTGPWMTRVAHYPIKPGSLSFHSDVGGVTSDWTDNGDGTLSSTSTYFAGGTVNYISGEFGRSSTTDLTGMDIVFTANYTHYAYSVTPAAGATTTAAGVLTASITVPSVANGNYNVTAIDSQGNRASATLVVDSAIPEGLTIGVMVLLSSVAMVAGARYFRKRPKIESYNSVKP
jgi:hypothetical protein